MSNDTLYFSHPQTPDFKYVRQDSLATVVIWAPTASGNQIVLTGLTVTNNAAKTTMTFYQGTTVAGPDKVGEFVLGASAIIRPFDGLGPIVLQPGNTFYGRALVGATDSQHIVATGHENRISTV